MKKRLFCGMLSLALILSGCAKAPTVPDASCVQSASVTSAEGSTLPETEKKETETASSQDGETEEALSPFTAQDAALLEAYTVLLKEQVEEAGMEALFYAQEIPDAVFERMKGLSFKDNCTVPREELRYVRVLHVGFDGETHIGELVVNKAIAQDVVEIFETLYKASYPIEKIRLVDEYGADDEESMADNNSSSFNFRTIAGTDTVSRHGYGMAIDINPLYNPYVTSKGFSPANSGDYVDRSKEIPWRIDEGDLCWQTFIDHGFEWGGSWKNSKDYQHFEKN